jgi:DNA polymerase
MDQPAKHRARMLLRAERAFGLRMVPAPAESASAPAHSPPPRIAQVQSPAQAPPVPERLVFGDPAAGLVEEELMPPPSRAAFDAPTLSAEEKRVRLLALDENEVRGCTKCRLCETRTQTVFGDGDADAKIFFIGEGPGENEDLQGRPFVGRAGELLNKMIVAMGLTRQQVYIANIVKCRPPNNRVPAPDEVATCTPYLERQLEIIRPKVIVTLGLPAARYMLRTKESMGRLRGKFQAWRGIKLMPTFHPAYVLRQYTAETRAAVWSDLKQVMAAVKE